MGGLGGLLTPAGTRFVGLGFVFLLAAMIGSHAKHYYPADIYPVLFAAGAVAVERATDARPWLRPVVTSVAVAAGPAASSHVLPPPPLPAFPRFPGFVSSRLRPEATPPAH